MNNNFTNRMRIFMSSFIMLCCAFFFNLEVAQAYTTTIKTDSSWLVTNTIPPASWNTLGFVPSSAWVAPGPGRTVCNQVGLVGVNKIWHPSTAANQTNYFIKKFNISQLCEVKSVILDLAVDDYCVVFINGIIVANGNVNPKTVTIPVSILRCENVIAIQARDLGGNCWWMSAKLTINSTPIAIAVSSNSTSANPICAGQNLNLFASSLAGATYSWTGPSGFTSSLQNPIKTNIAIGDSGMYNVTVISGKCCRYSGSVRVGVKNCTDCLDLTSKEVFCKNGLYYLTVCVKNNSSHIANSINLISSTAGVNYTPNILSPSGGLLPGQTYCATVQVSGSGAVNGALVCLKAMLLEIKNCQPVWFCASKEDLCVTLPNCQIPPPCQWVAMVKDSILTICRGTSTTLSASTSPVIAGATYSWTSSPTSTIVNGTTAMPTVTPTVNPTVYTVTISSVNADGTICKKKATVTVYLKVCPPPIPCDSVKVGFNSSNINLCLGDSVQLNPITNPVTGLTYLWTPSTGLSNATIKNPWAKPTVTTTYNLIVGVAGTNCKKDASITVTVKQCPPPNPCDLQIAVRDTLIRLCRGKSVVLKASSNVSLSQYSWSPSTGVSGPTNLDSLVVSPSVTTTYTVMVSLPNNPNCVRTRTVRVEVIDCPTGQRKAAEEEAINDIIIAPNPTQSIISVQIPDSMNWEKATLINAQGIILNEQERVNEAKTVKFDVQTQPSGMYIISVKTNKGFVNKKVIKE